MGLVGCGEDPATFQTLGRNGPTVVDTSSFDAAPEYLRTFKSGELETADITVDTGFNLIRNDFLLAQLPKTEVLHQQLERLQHEDIFQQGHSGIQGEQSFAISEAGVFDLLLVIDDSSSMAPYQNRLSQTLPNLLRYMSNTNWQIAVVSTTSPCLRKTPTGKKVLKRAEYDANPTQAEADFRQLIRVGENGDTNEKGILIATQAMTGQGCAAESNTWLRNDSQRAILLLSDERNCGSASNEGCPGAPWEKANYFYDRVGTNVTFSALLLLQEPPAADPSNPNDPNRDCENSGGYLDPPNPAEYVNLVQGTSGLVADICRSDYRTVIEQISLDVSKKINVQFELEFPAVTEGMSLTMDGSPIRRWVTSGRTVTVLDPVSATNRTITIRYKHSPVTMRKNFNPLNPSDPRTFEVLVNNERLQPSEFNFNPNSGALELKSLPPERAEVKVRYRRDAPLIRNFSYPEDFVDGSVEVMVGDQKTLSYGIDKPQRRIVFNEPPLDGQRIKILYEKPGDKTLKYPVLGAFPDHVESFELLDRESGVRIEADMINGELVLPAESVANGRKVRAVYNLKHEFKNKIFNVAFDKPPFPGTVEIAAAGDKQVCTRDLEVGATGISFACADEDFEQVQVRYRYAKNYRNSFDLDIAYSGPRDYTVYINGTPTENYTIIDEKLVILKKDLAPGSDVKVLVKPR
jgi:hypothetical protein